MMANKDITNWPPNKKQEVNQLVPPNFCFALSKY